MRRVTLFGDKMQITIQGDGEEKDEKLQKTKLSSFVVDGKLDLERFSKVHEDVATIDLDFDSQLRELDATTKNNLMMAIVHILMNNKKLSALNLSRVNLSDAQIKILTLGISASQSLSVLKLAGNSFTSEGSSALALALLNKSRGFYLDVHGVQHEDAIVAFERPLCQLMKTNQAVYCRSGFGIGSSRAEYYLDDREPIGNHNPIPLENPNPLRLHR